MKRLFTFGCSFTAYEWPTWADILGRQFDYFENWGRPGAGNQFICNSIAECDARNNFTEDDTIIVMWSSMMREDRYVEDGWLTPGNFGVNGEKFNEPGWPEYYYGKDFYHRSMITRGCYIRDLASMYLVDKLIKSKKCEHHYLSMIDLNFPGDMYWGYMTYFMQKLKLAKQSETTNDVLHIYKTLCDQIKPSVHKVVFNYDWQSRPVLLAPSSKTGKLHRTDWHPIPSEHLEYLQKVLPQYIITDENKAWVKEVSEQVCNYTFYKNTSWNPLMYRPKIRL